MTKTKLFYIFSWICTIKASLINSTLLLPFFVLQTAFAQTIHFEIIAGPLNNVLLSIAQQADMQLVMRANIDNPNTHINSTVIKRRTSLNLLLSEVLKPTKLTYQILQDKRVILITPKPLPNTVDSKNDNKHKSAWEHILITGQGSHNRNLLSSSTSVTYLDSTALQQLSNENTAEIFHQIPGFWVEGSGGETNNNVAPRGLRGGEGFRFISLMEDGIPIVYDGIWPDFFLRQDILTQGVEVIRGGSSGIFTFNGPAAIVNFISQKGSAEQVNRIKLSKGLDYQFTRVDGLMSGAINEQWFYALGGFYRTSDGVREPGYNADNGGQFKINLTGKFNQAEVNLSYRYLNDKTSFFSPIPMTNAHAPQSIENVNANYATLLSNDFNQLTFKSPDGNFQRDIKDGQQSQLHRFSATLDWDLSDKIALKSKLSFADMKNTMYTMMNLGNDTLFNATQRLRFTDVTKFITENQDQGAVKAAYTYSHNQEIIDKPAQLNSNGLVTYAYPLYSYYQQNQWINHFSANFDLNNVQVSLGHLFAHNDFSSLPLDKWQGEILIEVKDQPDRLDIVALNSQGNIIATYSEQGFTSYVGPGYLDGVGKALSNSLYIYIEWQPITPLVLDLGLRWENLSLQSTASTDALYSLPDSNFPAIYSSGHSFYKSASYNEFSWSIGGNYQLSAHSALFFHLSHGFEMPKLINFGNEIGWGDYQESIPSEAGFGKPVKLTFAESGLRIADINWHITATLFETRFNPLPFTVFRGIYDSQQNIFINTQTRGIEFEFNANITERLSINGLGVWQKALLSGIPSDASESIYNGNQITRTPELQIRISPRYQLDKTAFFLTYAYVGQRYSDIANNFELHDYSVIDLGLTYQITKQINLTLQGKNVTNSIGLTEGNPRNAIAHSDSTNFYARSIFGRSVLASVEVSF